MKLPVWRQLPYISPSTFLKWEACNHRIYLARLAGFKYMRTPQNYAAAVGSAFDAYIKNYIAVKRGVISLALELNTLLAKNVDREHWDTAVPKGKEIAEIYIKLGLAEAFLQAEHDIHLDMELYRMIQGIPILGQLDLAFNNIPDDWKTGGFGKSPRYVTKGYEYRIDYNLSINQYNTIVPLNEKVQLEDKNYDWAVQLTMYSWLLGTERGLRRYRLNEIMHHNGTISFAIHTGIISEAFSDSLWLKVSAMWQAITEDMYSAEIKQPEPRKQLCEKYGFLCEVAEVCKYYETTLGDEGLRENYV